MGMVPKGPSMGVVWHFEGTRQRMYVEEEGVLCGSLCYGWSKVSTGRMLGCGSVRRKDVWVVGVYDKPWWGRGRNFFGCCFQCEYCGVLRRKKLLPDTRKGSRKETLPAALLMPRCRTKFYENADIVVPLDGHGKDSEMGAPTAVVMYRLLAQLKKRMDETKAVSPK